MVDNMKRELRMSIYVYFRSDDLSLSTVVHEREGVENVILMFYVSCLVSYEIMAHKRNRNNSYLPLNLTATIITE